MESESQSFDYEPVRPSRARRRLGEIDSAVEWLPPKGDKRDRQQTEREPEHDAEEATQSLQADDTKSLSWNLRRGHMLSFVVLFLYTAMAYFRPYELVPALAWTVSLPYWMAIGMLAIFIPSQFMLEGRLTARPREVNLLLLLGLIGLLSIPQALSPGIAWETFYTLFVKSIIVFIVMVNAVRTELRLRTLIFLGLAASAFMSATAISNYSSGNTGVYADRAIAKVGNMFGEPNTLALFLLTMVPIALAFLLSDRNVLKKAVYGVVVLMMLTGILVTQSRGGFLGLVAAALVLAWKLGRRNRLAAVGLIVAGALAMTFLAPGGYQERMASIIDPSLDPGGSATARRALLTESVLVALKSPILGVGIGNMGIVLIHAAVSHNAYTQVAGEMGLIALVLYVMFLVIPYKRLREIERETLKEYHHSRFYYLAIGLQASLVGYMVASFFLSVAYDWFIYFLVGYAIGFRRIYQTRPEAIKAEPQSDERKDTLDLRLAALP